MLTKKWSKKRLAVIDPWLPRRRFDAWTQLVRACQIAMVIPGLTEIEREQVIGEMVYAYFERDKAKYLGMFISKQPCPPYGQ